MEGLDGGEAGHGSRAGWGLEDPKLADLTVDVQDDSFAALVAADGELAAGPDLHHIPDVGGDDAVQNAVFQAWRVLVADLENLDPEGALGVSVVLEKREAIVLGVDTTALCRALWLRMVVVSELVGGVARL